jgi:large subunit ribosomal protein L23
MTHAEIIIKPLVTEKSSGQAELANTYSFQVAPAANKHQIKAAVEALYTVKVTGVRTLTRKDKPKRNRFGLLHTGGYKRAIVTLGEGSKIELF